MKVAEMYPSKYLSAADLQGREFPLTISTVTLEQIQDGNSTESKPVMRFERAQKSLVLNKTNCDVISAAYGGETDLWAGKPVILYPTMTQFQGRQVPCLRVRLPGQAMQPAGQPGEQPAGQPGEQLPAQAPPAIANAPAQKLPVGETTGDEIPF
jgi:hypothetical protein